MMELVNPPCWIVSCIATLVVRLVTRAKWPTIMAAFNMAAQSIMSYVCVEWFITNIKATMLSAYL